MEFTTLNELLQPVLENGMDGLAEVMQATLNLAMLIERENALQAKPYQRTSERQGYANGFKTRTIKSRLGELTLDIPQTRDCKFYPTCLEKGLRSERAINAAIAEMYIQGVATRNVRNILEKMCGLDVTAMQVSRATSMLDEELEAWRQRKLEEPVRVLLLDARYEKVRVEGNVIDCAVLLAYGVQENGIRRVLGCSVELSEAEVHWRHFLESLSERGLHGLELIVSDSHAGLQAARKSVFPAVPWQRCQFHLQQNIAAHINKKDMQKEVHDDVRCIFNMPERQDAEELLKRTVKKYRELKADKLADWMELNIPEGFTVYQAVDTLFARKRLRTTNMVEFQNKELKKRTRNIRVFPNKESLLRIITALLVELDEKWLTDNRSYI